MTGAGAISAKLCAMYGNRLTQQDYEAMVQRRSVPEVAAYLKNATHFHTCLTNMQENSIHRGQLELLLGRQLFDDVTRLKRYDRNGLLFTLYDARLEIRQIISFIGLLREGRQAQFIVNVPGYLLGKLQIDLDAMVQARQEAELLQILRHTPYYKTLYRLYQAHQAHFPSVSVCAAQLNTDFHRRMLAQLDRQYHGQVRAQLRQLLLLRIEMQNLTIAYRMKQYFHANGTQIAQHTMPLYHTINKRAMGRLLDAPDAAAFFDEIRRTRLWRHIDSANTRFVEHQAAQYQLSQCRKSFDFSTDPAVKLVSFLTLREIEMNNVLTIIEGVRYHVPPDEITKLLVLKEVNTHGD